jgi:hypothetical protein
MSTFLATLVNPACGNKYSVPIQADTYEQARYLAEQQYKTLFYYMSTAPVEQPQ